MVLRFERKKTSGSKSDTLYSFCMAKITGKDIQAMVKHWLRTPVNGYLGSDYGQDLKSLLQRPLNDGMGDAVLQKLRGDVPVIGVVPSSAVNLLQINGDSDKKTFCIEIAGNTVEIDSGMN